MKRKFEEEQDQKAKEIKLEKDEEDQQLQTEPAFTSKVNLLEISQFNLTVKHF